MRYISITAFAILLMLVGRQSPGQSQPALTLADEKSDLRLEIKTAGSTFRAGDPVVVHIDLRNIKDVPVRVSQGRPAEPFFRFVVVKVENSGLSVPVQLAQTGKQVTDPINDFAFRSRMLPVGESDALALDISPWYSWAPGTYKVACYYDMPATEGHLFPKLRYSSNELTLTVTQ